MIHAINQFMGYDFFCCLEIGAFAYFCCCVQRFAFSRQPKQLPFAQRPWLCAETLAPIFEESAQFVRQAKPSLSSLIREEVADKGIRELRQEVRDRKLQQAIKEQMGKSVSACSLAELRQVLQAV